MASEPSSIWSADSMVLSRCAMTKVVQRRTDVRSVSGQQPDQSEGFEPGPLADHQAERVATRPGDADRQQAAQA